MLVAVSPKHQLVRVETHDSNPTLNDDEINAGLALDIQLPPDNRDQIPSCYDEDLLEKPSNYQGAALGSGTTLCYRVTAELRRAQEFFDARRREIRWDYEYPIYRTARWWCKRYYKVSRNAPPV